MRQTALSASATDRRRFERVSTTLRGKVFPGARDCVIHDYSKRGARLGFVGEPPSDEQMVMVIWTTGLAYEVTRRWASGHQIGVQFTRPIDLRGPAPAHLAEIKTQWLNRRQRLRRRELNSCGAVERWVSPHDVRIS
jgi:hypothetical protein